MLPHGPQTALVQRRFARQPLPAQQPAAGDAATSPVQAKTLSNGTPMIFIRRVRPPRAKARMSSSRTPTSAWPMSVGSLSESATDGSRSRL